MNSLLFQFVALTSSFLLTLPAGWCGGWMHDRAEPASAVATCCHQNGPGASSDRQEMPVPATIECCCSWDATVPPKGGDLSDSSSLADRLADADFTNRAGSVKASETVSRPLRSGPRLHVLQCVWRC